MSKNKKLSVKDWYNSKRLNYKRYFNEDWTFLNWDDYKVQETLMRIAIEKRYFGLTTFDEDVMICNCVIIRDLIAPRKYD